MEHEIPIKIKCDENCIFKNSRGEIIDKKDIIFNQNFSVTIKYEPKAIFTENPPGSATAKSIAVKQIITEIILNDM
jgi:hypothetical protein